MEAAAAPQGPARGYGHEHEAVGEVVTYVDELSQPHKAVLTAVWASTQADLGQCAVNLVYVSVSAQGPHTAHGRYYTV